MKPRPHDSEDRVANQFFCHGSFESLGSHLLEGKNLVQRHGLSRSSFNKTKRSKYYKEGLEWGPSRGQPCRFDAGDFKVDFLNIYEVCDMFMR